MRLHHALVSLALVAGTLGAAGPALAAPSAPGPAADTAAHWTAQRRAEAVPRDLFLDERGLAYTRSPGGGYEPYGHDTPVQRRDVADAGHGRTESRAKPSGSGGGGGKGGKGGKGGGDTTAPSISGLSPCAGDVIGPDTRFSALVGDAGGVAGVEFELLYPAGGSGFYRATAGTGGEWYVPFGGFWDGNWAWRVHATDASGNTAVYPAGGQPFTVDAADPQPICEPATPSADGVVGDAAWTIDDTMKHSSGRIFFEMPDAGGRLVGYVCSGTALADDDADRTVIVTAAHCVYDDADKAFARNVLFIPDQDRSASGTDTDCSNDRYGCWVPTVAVVDAAYTGTTFPDNNAVDYGFYVVDSTNVAATTTTADLDQVVGGVGVRFDAPTVGHRTYALGYSYDHDPDLRFCAEDLGTRTVPEGTFWFLADCDMNGGSSGGPWVQSADNDLTGDAIVSVNSWGYVGAPGMAGPALTGSARCLHTVANGPDAVPTAGGGPLSGLTVDSGSCTVV